MLNTIKNFESLGYTIQFTNNAWHIASLKNPNSFQYLGNMTQVKERYNELITFKSIR